MSTAKTLPEPAFKGGSWCAPPEGAYSYAQLHAALAEQAREIDRMRKDCADAGNALAEVEMENERQSTNAVNLAQQVADLTAELQREHEDHKQTNEDAAMYMREAERLTAERDALRADAERYRHLKEHCVRENDDGEKCVYFWCGFEHYNDVNAAIDAAKAKP